MDTLKQFVTWDFKDKFLPCEASALFLQVSVRSKRFSPSMAATTSCRCAPWEKQVARATRTWWWPDVPALIGSLPWTNSHFSSQICHFPKRFDTAKDCTAHGHCYSPGHLETCQKCLTADVIELQPVYPGQVELHGRAGDTKLSKLGRVVRPCLCRIPIHYCYWCI